MMDYSSSSLPPPFSIGVDIETVQTIRELLERHGDQFKQKVFTAAEIAYCQGKKNELPSFAARYAAKEATMKALKTGWDKGIQWKHIEIKKTDPVGFPTVVLHKKALELFTQQGFNGLDVSLSHSNDYVVATVLLYR